MFSSMTSYLWSTCCWIQVGRPRWLYHAGSGANVPHELPNTGRYTRLELQGYKTYISGILLALNLLKLTTPILNGPVGFLDVPLTQLPVWWGNKPATRCEKLRT